MAAIKKAGVCFLFLPIHDLIDMQAGLLSSTYWLSLYIYVRPTPILVHLFSEFQYWYFHARRWAQIVKFVNILGAYRCHKSINHTAITNGIIQNCLILLFKMINTNDINSSLTFWASNFSCYDAGWTFKMVKTHVKCLTSLILF